jgi:hypothetical protein
VGVLTNARLLICVMRWAWRGGGRWGLLPKKSRDGVRYRRDLGVGGSEGVGWSALADSFFGVRRGIKGGYGGGPEGRIVAA